MTNTFKGKETSETKSFKAKILADLEEAKRLRLERDDALAKAEKELQKAARQTMQSHSSGLGDPVKHWSSETKQDYAPENEAVEAVLANLDEVFTPDTKTDTKEIDSVTATVHKSAEFPLLSPKNDEQAEAVHSQESMPKVSSEASLVKESEVTEMPSDAAATTKEVAEEVDSSIPPSDQELAESQNKMSDKESEEERMRQKRRRKAKKKNRLARKIATMLAASVVLILLVLGLFTYTYVTSALKPVDKTASKFVQVEIPKGSGNKLIGQILEKSGLIKNASIFNYYTKFKNYGNFQSGYYNLQQSMSLEEIAKILQKGGTAQPSEPVLGKVLIPEGYTIQQISEAIVSNANTKSKKDKTPYTAKAFLEKVQDKDFIAKMVKKYPNLLGSLPDASKVKYQLEGYLFPATYSYSDKTSLEDLIDSMLAATDANLATYYDTIKAKQLTVNEVLTLASLVEKEGATDDDRKMIASVFYNRLNQNMPLQSNIAILYAMNKLGTKTSLAEDAGIDTNIDSPYNIYKNTGLMPGAVDSPGLSAIKAVIEPASTEYLYFVADVTTGDVHYAKTFEDHQANVDKYVNSKLKSSASN